MTKNFLKETWLQIQHVPFFICCQRKTSISIWWGIFFFSLNVLRSDSKFCGKLSFLKIFTTAIYAYVMLKSYFLMKIQVFTPKTWKNTIIKIKKKWSFGAVTVHSSDIIFDEYIFFVIFLHFFFFYRLQNFWINLCVPVTYVQHASFSMKIAVEI